jgi:Skp family chaperone for outer membrane proteins
MAEVADFDRTAAKRVRTEALEEGLNDPGAAICPFRKCGGQLATVSGVHPFSTLCVGCRRWHEHGIVTPRAQGVCCACLKTLKEIGYGTTTQHHKDWTERDYHKSCFKRLGYPRTIEKKIRIELQLAEDELNPEVAQLKRQSEEEARLKQLEDERESARKREEERQRKTQEERNTRADLILKWALEYKQDYHSLKAREELLGVVDALHIRTVHASNFGSSF